MRKGNEELQRENKRLSDQIQNQQELHSAEVQELQRQVRERAKVEGVTCDRSKCFEQLNPTLRVR